MKASSKENEIKRYSLTSNTFESDITNVNTHEVPTSSTQQKHELKKTFFPNKNSSEKNFKTLSFYNHAQPCPFTFLTAVKCKFPVDKSYASCNSIYKSDKVKKVHEYSMDPVEPLNIPNLQISPKVCHVSEKIEGSNEKLITSKKSDSSYKSTLDNSSDALTYSKCRTSTVTTTLKSKNFELRKAPNVVPSKGKIPLKSYARESDSSRDKENRFKKIKKEDISSAKSRNEIQSIVKCSRNQKHISRKDILDKGTNKIIKNDNILNRGFKDNGNAIEKTAKKNREKPHKYSKFLTKSQKEISVKSNTCLTGKLVVDEDHQNPHVNIDNCKGKDDNQVLNILNPNVEPILLDHQNNSNSAESTDMISQDYLKHLSNQKSTKLSEDSAMASVEKYQKQGVATPSLILSTNKEDIFQNSHIQPNNVQHVYSTVVSANDSNQSSNDSIIETKLSEDSLSEKLMDPLRISFRDNSYSNQPEFSNLVTPNVNLTIRSKRRKQVINYLDSDDDYTDSKLSRKDQNAVQGVEVRAKTESNTSDKLVCAQRPTHFIEGSTQDKASSSSSWGKMSDIITESKSINTENNEKEIKKWPTLKITDKSCYLEDNIQTETISCQYGDDTSLVFSKECTNPKETFHISLNSGGGCEDASRIDDISLSKKMRTMSEISLHETTSSIRTESGTEISISLRDVTCSFNKNLDLEMAQLIDDERQRYNKIEMLFKSREKSLNDRTRKLVKLEEEKKVLRDKGQDSRISSVKKKQRALLLKLQQEKEEMIRLKELHKIASQERKLMLQKQRDMFNPDMSTKNILHKLKRSADSQSPRRLSGPMKGYDIRSNSSISSLIDSDKSQLDRSKFDCTMNMSDVKKENKTNSKLGIDRFHNKASRSGESHDTSFSKIEAGKYFKEATMSQVKCDLRSKKFDERMPKSDMKYQLYDFESVLENGAIELLKDDKHISLSRSKDPNFIFENVRKKSNAFIEEFTEIWKSHFSHSKNEGSVGKPSNAAKPHGVTTIEKLDGASSAKLQSNSNLNDDKSTKRKGLKLHKSKTLPTSSSNTSDLGCMKETFYHKSKSSEAIDKKDFGKNYDSTELDEFSSNTKQISVRELIKHSDLLKERNEELLKDIVDERNNFEKQSSGILLSSREQERKKEEEEEEIIEKSDNVSVQSHVSLAISHQSSNESDKSYLKSVVIRSQQEYQPNSSFQTSKKLEQILKAREATLISRRNCVEEWISWHARLRDEEERVSRMEKAAYKLVSATARTLSLNDSTISSDNSDVEGRIKLLTKKLSDRRFEMTRLKKEARKQAKRRLRALEANLLTQIKRYDATINEMRKKLETKKVPNKESTKLEIESKSVNDYKVPDIPIKNIQEIYKRSGLLRSLSDSDVSPINKNDVRDESNDIEATSSRVENRHAERATKSNSILGEECKSASTCTGNSYKSQSQPKIKKSEISDINIKGSNLSRNSNISEQSLSKVGSIVLEKNTNGNSNTEEKLTRDSEDGTPLISKKLSHIQLHNKELKDDIHNLENDLRELSEMMLIFSKKSSDQNSVSMDSTRKTSKAMGETCSNDMLTRLDKSKLDIESDTIDTDLQTRVKETLLNGIPDTDDISTSIEELYSEIKSKDERVGQRSYAPETSEQSIETEELHRMSKCLRPVDQKDYKSDTCSILEIISTSVEKGGEESVINEFDHQLDHQTETSSKLLSNDSDNHLKMKGDDINMSSRSTDSTLQNKSELTDKDRESSIQTRSRDDIHQVGSKDECEGSQLSDKSQKVAYPIENKNELEPLAFENPVDSDNVLTELDSFRDEHDKNERKSIERQAQDVQIVEDYDRNSISNVEDSTIFAPKGESTNLLESFVLKLDNSIDIDMGICSEEFNDILEIIERETKNDDKQENVFQETNSCVETKKDNISTSNIHNQTYHERSFDEESIKSQESKKSTVESEKIFDNANNDANSSEVNHDAISSNDQCGQTITQSNSFIKQNEDFEHAKVHRNEDDSSDGEQSNNLIEVVENKLDMLQKSTVPRENKIWPDKHKTHVTVFLDKTLQVIRDPEYEDISEESLEVSDIFNNTNLAFHKNSKKLTPVPEKYIIKSESNEVLRILDEISNKSNKFDHDPQEIAHDDLKYSPIDTNLSAESSSNENVSPLSFNQLSRSKQDDPSEKISEEIVGNLRNEIALNKSNIVEDDVKQKLHTNSEKFSTLNDDKRNVNLDIKQDSYLDTDTFHDSPINNNAILLDEKAKDTTAEFRTTAMGVSSEKDIETMIKKLKASLEQPGIEVADSEAKLLEIEKFQIELAIKKLEAEEVSYYVREIPNKPPPPYTPPGSVRQTGSNGVFSFSIIPTNIEELTFVTEKATAIIHVKKKSGEDVQFLEAPDEIYESVRDPSDAVKKNRLIYNTFLFDLCKELIVDIYKVEEENPGPSWTKPKVKTKRVIKIPKSVNELNEYVSKEVATLFGFKTKLQRENMVMRWSRKRRDRVDELLAKEAQAEEKEWTKFHHDELAVKNELTVTILNNLLMETTSCIKNAYAKKRKLGVL